MWIQEGSEDFTLGIREKDRMGVAGELSKSRALRLMWQGLFFCLWKNQEQSLTVGGGTEGS